MLMVSCLYEDAKMGYLQKLILFLSICRHYLDEVTKKEWRETGIGLFSLDFYFTPCIFKFL